MSEINSYEVPLNFDPNQRSLFVVGDDAQSIYGFRGSKIELILNFERYYPNVTEIVLDQNYRSTQNILDLAEKVLTHSKKQKPKNLKASGVNGNSDIQVKHYRANNEKEEAEFIVAQIAGLVEQTQKTENGTEDQDNKKQGCISQNSTNQGSSKAEKIKTTNSPGVFNSYVPNTEIDDRDAGLNPKKDNGGFLSFGSQSTDNQSSKSSSGGSFFDNLFDKYTQDMDSSLPTGIGQSSYSWEEQEGRTKMNFNLNSKMNSCFENWQPMSYEARFGFQNYRHINWKECSYLNEVVVLYRTNSQSRSIEEAFIKHKIPYKLASGVSFLNRKEVKDVLSILKFVASSDDKISLKRFLPLLVSGIGEKTLEKILAFLEDPDYPLPPKHQSQVYEILEIIQNVWQDSGTLRELTENLLEKLGYWEYLKKEYSDKEERQTRIDNIKELYSIMLEFDEIDQEYAQIQSNQSSAQNLVQNSAERSSDQDQDSESEKDQEAIESAAEKTSEKSQAENSSFGFGTLESIKKAKLKPASEILFGGFESMSEPFSQDGAQTESLNGYGSDISSTIGQNQKTQNKKSRQEMDQKLTTFLNSVMLMSSQEQSDNQYKVTLMTLHQSKGLEFETVFLVGIEDGILPHINSFYEEGGMDEEVRLSYVGVTRAKKNLFLTSALSRVLFGRVESYPVSRIFRPFLKDL